MEDVNLNLLVPEYFEVDEMQKSYKKKRDKLNSKIKSTVTEGISYIETEKGNFELNKSIQERTKLDEEQAVKILKELGHEGAVKTVEVPDQEALEDLIFQGLISPEQLASAVQVNKVEVLKIKKEKVNL